MDWKDGKKKKKNYNLAKLRGIWKLQLILYKEGSVCLPAIMNSLRTTQQFKNSPKNLSTYRGKKKTLIRDIWFLELKIAIHILAAS